MQIYSPSAKGPLKISGFIDPDDNTKISVYWGAPVFSPNTVYRLGDITRPTIDNGFYYQCSTNGVSGSSEPKWDPEESISGGVVFIAVPWNLWIFPTEKITNSVWSTNIPQIDISVSNFNDYMTNIFVSNIPDTSTSFQLSNQVTKANGEKVSRTFLYKVYQQ